MKNRKKIAKTIITLVISLVLAFFIYKAILSFLKLTEIESIHTLNYSSLLTLIEDDMVDSIRFEDGDDPSTVTIWPKSNAKYYYDNIKEDVYEVEVLDKITLLELLQNKREDDKKSGKNSITIKVEEKEESISFGDIGGLLFSIAYIMFIVYLIMPESLKKKLGLSSFFSHSIERKKIDFYEKTMDSNVTFDDVAGLVEEKEELKEIVDFLKFPDDYLEMGAKLPKGVLLSGEPGTGKTLLAKAVANEAGVEYLAASGAEFVEEYVGRGAGRIRDLFEDARELAPCIVFIDEIDAFGRKRNDSDSNEYNQTLEQLLTELDGFNSSDNIIVLAATNRLSALDAALTRPGRFDRTIEFLLPDITEREEILRLHARNKKFMDNVDFKSIAYETSGCSGADLEGLLNEAAIHTVKCKRTAISNSDISEAFNKVKLGLQKPNRIISEKEKCITAYHESGHAIVSKFFKTAVKEISIIPRGRAGGYTVNNAVEEKMYYTKNDFNEKIIILLAGRVAEKITIGDITTGAANDLEKATKIAKDMIVYYGMDPDIGPVSLFDSNSAQNEFFGENIFNNVGDKITITLKEAEDKAEKILTENRELLEQLKELLLKQEKISGTTFDKIFQEYMNKKAANA